MCDSYNSTQHCDYHQQLKHNSPENFGSNHSNTNTTEYDSSTDNDAIYFVHPLEMLVPWIINPYFFPIVTTYIITFIVGVTGNLIVIWVMTGDKTNRSVTSIFLVSLAVSDLLLLMICAPLDVAHYFVVQWDREGTICKLAAYAESVSAYASVLNLVAVTFERFVVIVFPIRSRSLCTMSNCKRIMILVWMISLLMATPVIFTKNTMKSTFTNMETSVTLFSCKELNDWRGFTVSLIRFVTLFALPSVMMIVCYTWVIIELWISTKTMDELTQNSIGTPPLANVRVESRASISHDQGSPTHPHRLILRSHTQNDNRDVKKARQQVIKMLILVVILFLICWGPRLIMEIIIKCCLSVFNHGTYMLRIIFYLSPFVHSCLNPIVYGFMSTKFRRKLLRCLERKCRCLGCRKPSARTAQSRLKNAMSTSMSTTMSTRNGNSRIGSSYTFTSYAPSLSCSQSADTIGINPKITVSGPFGQIQTVTTIGM